METDEWVKDGRSDVCWQTCIMVSIIIHEKEKIELSVVFDHESTLIFIQFVYIWQKVWTKEIKHSLFPIQTTWSLSAHTHSHDTHINELKNMFHKILPSFLNLHFLLPVWKWTSKCCRYDGCHLALATSSVAGAAVIWRRTRPVHPPKSNHRLWSKICLTCHLFGPSATMEVCCNPATRGRWRCFCGASISSLC